MLKLPLLDDFFMCEADIYVIDVYSQFPNYFGEITLWTGIATVAAGTMARKPIQLALGLSGGLPGILTTTALAFVSLLLRCCC